MRPYTVGRPDDSPQSWMVFGPGHEPCGVGFVAYSAAVDLAEALNKAFHAGRADVLGGLTGGEA